MRVLDLFCGAGGASMGYHQAWPDAEIVGIDIDTATRLPVRVHPNGRDGPATSISTSTSFRST